VLEVCDEVVVNVGRSDDETRQLVAGIGDSRVRIIDSEWDLSQGDGHCSPSRHSGRWTRAVARGIYIQATKSSTSAERNILRHKVAEWDRDEQVEGMLVDYLHFLWGLRSPWRRIANGIVARSAASVWAGTSGHTQGAQGFRVGAEYRKIRAVPPALGCFTTVGLDRPTRCGEARADERMYPWATERLDRELKRGTLKWIPLLRPFTGSHPTARGAGSPRTRTSHPRDRTGAVQTGAPAPLCLGLDRTADGRTAVRVLAGLALVVVLRGTAMLS